MYKTIEKRLIRLVERVGEESVVEERAAEGNLVGAFDFVADRDAASQSEIFAKATFDYMFPLGTAVTCGHRPTTDGTEYLFVAKSTPPEGAEAYTSIYVLAPDSANPVFTRVVR